MDTAYDDDDPIPDMTEFQHNELVYYLTRSPEVHATTSRALKQAVYAGGGVLVGGVVFGPLGGLVGGIVGSFMGYAKSENYKGVVSHLARLNEDQRKTLLRKVGSVLTAAGATESQLSTAQNFRTTLINLASQDQVRDAIWKACVETVHST